VQYEVVTVKKSISARYHDIIRNKIRGVAPGMEATKQHAQEPFHKKLRQTRPKGANAATHPNLPSDFEEQCPYKHPQLSRTDQVYHIEQLPGINRQDISIAIQLRVA
jgi:hypothetical protein